MKLKNTINKASFLLVAAALVSLAASGCAQEPDWPEQDESEVPVLHSEDSPATFAATSELDLDSQEPDAFNYTPAPLADSQSVEPRSASTNFVDRWSGPQNQVEAKLFIGRHRAVVGVGARAKPGKVTTLRVQTRELKANGTLGSLREYRSGSNPNHNLEVWCQAPIGHLLTGLGSRIHNGDVTTMRIYYRRYNPNQRKLVGPVYSKGCGSSPNHALERRIVSWEEFTLPTREDRAVITGLSMRELNDDLNSLRLRFRFL